LGRFLFLSGAIIGGPDHGSCFNFILVWGRFYKIIIPLALVGYEMVIAQRALVE